MPVRRISRALDEGFTLVELLVVIIIIGVLAAIAIPLFISHRAKAWDMAVESDLRNAAIAQDAYLTEGGAGGFATTIAQLESIGFRPSPGSNYYGGSLGIAIGSSGTHYCLTARSHSGTYLGFSSDLGPVRSTTPLDPDACS
jgi:type IV pilus assembly protein PilA